MADEVKQTAQRYTACGLCRDPIAEGAPFQWLTKSAHRGGSRSSGVAAKMVKVHAPGTPCLTEKVEARNRVDRDAGHQQAMARMAASGVASEAIQELRDFIASRTDQIREGGAA